MNINNILLLLTFIFNFGGRTLYVFTKIEDFYYVGEALSWISIATYAYLKPRAKIVKPKFVENQIERVFTWCLIYMVLYNFWKEIMHNADKWDDSGYVLLILVSVTLVKRIYHIVTSK